MMEQMMGSVLEALLVQAVLIYLWITRGRPFAKMAIYA